MRLNIPALLVASLVAGSTLAAPATGLPDLNEKQIEQYKDFNKKATASLTDGKLGRAVRMYDRALAINPANEGAWYNLACAHAKNGQTAMALHALERSAEHGWSDADWPTKDEDLTILHETTAFEAWIAGVKEAANKPGTWPAVAPEEAADNEEALDEVVETWGAQISALKGVLGSTQTKQANRLFAAYKAASWDRIGATSTSPDVQAEAAFSAMAAIAGRDATRTSSLAAEQVVARAEQFLEAHAGSEHAPMARLRHAEASYAMNRKADGNAAGAAFENSLYQIAATNSEGAALESALLRLMSRNAKNTGLATRIHGRLLSSAEDIDAVQAKLAGNRSTRGLHYKLAGLPEFEATTLTGTTVNQASFKGKVTLLDFWATWCGPCKAELPHLKEAYKRYADAGFEIVGISLDGDKNEAEFTAWCEENGVVWPQIYDGKGWSAELAETFNVHSIPFVVLLDEEGKVAAIDDELRGEQLLDVVGELVMAGDSNGVGGH